MPTPSEIKKALVKAGFEVYQTRGHVVHVAQRVRENRIMASGVRIESATAAVVFGVRAHQNDFPGDGADALFDRARRLASGAIERGYAELETLVTPVADPGGGDRVLDTWCEVFFRKACGEVDAALEELRFALALEKTVSRR